MRIRLFVILALLSALSPMVARAEEPSDRSFKRIMSEVVVPGFDALAEQGQAHRMAWASYCAAPTPESLKSLAASFQSLADAWAAVEMFRSGPSSVDFRSERFNFWPERKNAVSRGLASLLKRAAAEDITVEKISAESAAIQGLPALERLIFTENGPDADLGASTEGKLHCEIGQAIAENAATIAAAMQEGWQDRAPDVDDKVKTEFATDLVTFLAVIKDTKIEAVIGESVETVKPHAAEFWRSGHTLRSITLNLETLAAINAILFDEDAEDISLPATTQSALSIARSLPPDLGALAAGPDRSSAILLLDAVDAAEERAKIEIPYALGVTVGFNSLDGD